MKHGIAVIPGDGIGSEVIEEGVKVLKATAEAVDELEFEFQYFPGDVNIVSRKER